MGCGSVSMRGTKHVENAADLMWPLYVSSNTQVIFPLPCFFLMATQSLVHWMHQKMMLHDLVPVDKQTFSTTLTGLQPAPWWIVWAFAATSFCQFCHVPSARVYFINAYDQICQQIFWTADSSNISGFDVPLRQLENPWCVWVDFVLWPWIMAAEKQMILFLLSRFFGAQGLSEIHDSDPGGLIFFGGGVIDVSFQDTWYMLGVAQRFCCVSYCRWLYPKPLFPQQSLRPTHWDS